MTNKNPKKYYLFDMQGKILGRAAVAIVKILSGRGKTDFSPHIDGGDYVVVINADKVRLSGNKTKKKIYYRYSGYPGGVKKTVFEKQLKEDSRKVVKRAVWGMLPKNKLRSQMMKRLRIYKGDQYKEKIDTHQYPAE